MGFTEEERATARRTAGERVASQVDAFLAGWQIDQPFQAHDLAEAVDNPKFDDRAAHLHLMELKDAGRVHHASGGWNPGPPPADFEIDQA